MKTRLLIAALFVLTAGTVIGYPLHQAKLPAAAVATTTVNAASVAKPGTRPRIEAVFVLDTTGSMEGLIQGAKDNIWSIASTMASAQPAPELKIGLVAFRDRGDQYVTRVVDLSTDLDSVYATLMDFHADGGGDTPESVNEALHDAVQKISWSQDRDAYKVIFLVGDAPAHMDYPDDVKFPDSIKVATARGIVVNTIQAGGDPDTAREWQQIANLNQGRFFHVGQGGDAIAMSTPFDSKIADLSKALDATRLFYGDDKSRQEMAVKVAASDKLHAFGSVAARAKRADFNASASGAKNFLGENELVEDVRSGKTDLTHLDAAQLPEPMRAMNKEAQAKLVEETAAKRAELKAQIQQLSNQRREFADAEIGKRNGAKDSLDFQLYDTIKEQAAAKGLRYEAKPVN